MIVLYPLPEKWLKFFQQLNMKIIEKEKFNGYEFFSRS